MSINCLNYDVTIYPTTFWRSGFKNKYNIMLFNVIKLEWENYLLVCDLGVLMLI
jgi:hypothetical protein